MQPVRVRLNSARSHVHKPILMLITSDKCRLCDEIRSKFVTSKAVDKLSKQFVLVNAVDEEDPMERSVTAG